MTRTQRLIMISAGEASGDSHAAHALLALQQRLASNNETVVTFGMGGTALLKAGCELVVDNRDLAVMGFVDVAKNYRRFRRRLAELREALRARRPQLLLIADYPDFNLKLAETARELGIPVLMYVAPQVWVWRAGRIPKIASLVSHMAVLFPFEVPIWEKAGVPTTCVGHPMVRSIDTTLTVPAARALISVPEDAMLVAVLPGSRSGEIKRLLPMMLKAVRRIAEQYPDCRFVLPLAPSIDASAIEEVMQQDREEAGDNVAPVEVISSDQAPATASMRAADVVLVASGTATLETGLIGTPMVVVYKVAELNAMIARRLIKIPNLALVNIVAERRIVPELLQENATEQTLASAVLELLADPDARDAMRRELAEVQHKLGESDATEAVAQLMDQLSDSQPTESAVIPP